MEIRLCPWVWERLIKREERNTEKGACWGVWALGAENWVSGVFSVLRGGRWKTLTCCGLLTFDKVAFCHFLCPCQAPPPTSPPPHCGPAGLGRGA